MLEESRLISRLDRYVIEKVAQLLRYQLENNLPMVPISVNLSRYDFILMDPLAFVERIVEQYHIPRYYLRIEVTESVLVKNRHLLIDKLRQFHQSGYQVWLDDFGSAYSSLNVLQNYEFDELKIDQGLLRYFNEDSRKIDHPLHRPDGQGDGHPRAGRGCGDEGARRLPALHRLREDSGLLLRTPHAV